MKFSKFLEFKYLEWQQKVGRKTVKEFAAYIGVSTSTISTWWHENRIPEGENIQKLASKLGIEVYDALDLPRPDPDLLYIQQNWQNLDPATRQPPPHRPLRNNHHSSQNQQNNNTVPLIFFY
mgnify:CR=1 FL=1